MTELKPVTPSNADTLGQASDTQLDALHERVNALLETPLPQEGDAWPLPVAETIAPETLVAAPDTAAPIKRSY